MVGWRGDHGGELGWSWGALELVQVYQPRYNPAVAQALKKGTRANNGHCTFLYTVESGEVAGCSSHPHKGSILKDRSHKAGHGNLTHGKPDGEHPVSGS